GGWDGGGRSGGKCGGKARRRKSRSNCKPVSASRTMCCATNRDDFRVFRYFRAFCVLLRSVNLAVNLAVNLVRFTAIEISPTCLNACGKLLRKAQLDGSICWGSNPSALARLQSEWKRSTASSNLP